MGTDNTSERIVQGTDITCERNVQGMDITSERSVQGTDITSDRNVQGTLITCESKVQEIDITCERNVQGTYSCLQDGDHTDGHYVTLLFAEKLTRTFGVLVHAKRQERKSRAMY